ncbi:hypothetical protein ABNF97_14525 [Plantactinospora sp. B6F1]|uniref:hypothetical protein n=1 Tax=Plantactinospora sp. B6F1 TaxID=3158971 RepID=UPI0010E911CA
MTEDDYGDAEWRAAVDGGDDLSPEEPVAPADDAPVSIREPFSQAEKRRNQRRMPT